MKMRYWCRKMIDVTLILAIIVLVYVSETFAQEQWKELNMIHYLSETQKLEGLYEMIAGFQEEYPGIEVNVEFASIENYEEILKLRIATGDAPDIIFGGVKAYSDLIVSGNIEDLTDKDFVERICPDVMKDVMVHEKIYGIALSRLANAVFYNKDIFRELNLDVPVTYREFIDTCERLEDAGYIACAAGYQDGISVGANFYTIFYGTPYLQCEDYVYELETGLKKAEEYPSLLKSLSQWREIMQHQNANQRVVNTDTAEQIFAAGEAGMLIIGTWGLGAVLGYNPQGNYGAFIFPSENQKEKNTIPTAAGDTWIVVKDAPNYHEAMAFCEYMTRPEVNAAWSGTVQEIGAVSKAETASLPQAIREIKEFLQEGKVSCYSARDTFSGEYFSAWGSTLLEFALTPDMTEEQFCEELNRRFAVIREGSMG